MVLTRDQKALLETALKQYLLTKNLGVEHSSVDETSEKNAQSQAVEGLYAKIREAPLIRLY